MACCGGRCFGKRATHLSACEMWSSHFRVFGYFLPFQASSPHLFLYPSYLPHPHTLIPPPPIYLSPSPIPHSLLPAPHPLFPFPAPPSLNYLFPLPTPPYSLISPPLSFIHYHLSPSSPSLHNSLVVSKTDCGPNQSHSPSKDWLSP